MPVEAYALVVMKRGIPFFSFDMDNPGPTRNDKISFCKIRLVDGRGKVPRWEVVEEIFDYKKGKLIEWGKTHEIPDRQNLTRLSDIDDRRVTLKQIQQLFPETKSMPFPIACDYVRDKI